jgi:hypothetical protein
LSRGLQIINRKFGKAVTLCNSELLKKRLSLDTFCILDSNPRAKEATAAYLLIDVSSLSINIFSPYSNSWKPYN